jgi:hypothetical protein
MQLSGYDSRSCLFFQQEQPQAHVLSAALVMSILPITAFRCAEFAVFILFTSFPL